ncbi:MAG: hypothetical protein RIG77_19355 [Cyclobacteriaceae bacterium]
MQVLTIPILTIFSCLLQAAGVLDLEPQETVSAHPVVIDHPGLQEDESRDFRLMEVKNRQGKTMRFYMDVESVICAENICKVVPVRMAWDTFGVYLDFELMDGVALEKGDGQPFEKEDYDLLRQVLKDGQSAFKDLTYRDITKTKTHGEVDAISGATDIILEEGASVLGASWTCFTLWHWAHGGVEREIQKIMGKSCTIEQLVGYVHSGNSSYQTFALDELMRRKSYEQELLHAILINAGNFEKEQVSKAIGYFQSGGARVYTQSMGKLFPTSNPEHNVLCLNSLLQHNFWLDNLDYDQLAGEISILTTYQEVDLMLRVLEKCRKPSEAISRGVMNLLERDILFARRAYYFLSGFELSALHKTKLENFRQQHEGEL